MLRRLHGFVSFLALGFLGAVPAVAGVDLSGLTSMSMVESPSSLLGLDLKALEWEVCGVASETIRGTVLVIASDGGGNSGDHSTLAVEVVGQEVGPIAGTVFASVRPVDFELLGGAPIVLSCGSFSYVVVLNRLAVQPISVLTLVAGNPKGTYGTCAGNLAIAAMLVLTRLTPPYETWSLPRSLTLEVAGHWALSLPAPGGRSPLALLAAPLGGRVVPWAECLSVSGEPGTSLCFAGDLPLAPPVE